MVGRTENRYSERYCGAASSHRPSPATIAAASIDQRLAHRIRRPTGAWIILTATAAPIARPPHHRAPTQPHSQIPDSARRSRLTCPSSMLPITGSKLIATRTNRTLRKTRLSSAERRDVVVPATPLSPDPCAPSAVRTRESARLPIAPLGGEGAFGSTGAAVMASETPADG